MLATNFFHSPRPKRRERGGRIFETVDASAGWDGKNALKGVYVWMITYENKVGKMFEMKGNVTLVKYVRLLSWRGLHTYFPNLHMEQYLESF